MRRLSFERRRGGVLTALLLSIVAVVLTTYVGGAGAQTTGTLVISEFRLRGPAVGPTPDSFTTARDEYVELYNNSDQPLTVAASDGSAGYALAASDGVVRFVIPNGTTIPPRSHFLGVNSIGYSPASYPAGNGTTATGDVTFTIDIADNQGIALFNTANPANFTSANRLDAVGSNAEANTLYREGAGYAALLPSTLDYAFFRDACGKQGRSNAFDPCPSPGLPVDTNNNGVDFVFTDTNGTNVGAGQRLGSPGPENLSSPARLSSATGLSFALLDTNQHHLFPPNHVRDPVADLNNNSAFGTVLFRRTFTNNTGVAITRLRFRILELTTFKQLPGLADLRARTSPSATVTLTGGGTVSVQGTTLEEPPAQASGGGYNSSYSAPDVSPASPLAPGASINLQFLAGVQAKGFHRLCLAAETLPATGGEVVCFGGHTDTVGPTPTPSPTPSPTPNPRPTPDPTVLLWENFFHGGDTAVDGHPLVTVDGQGNTIVAGRTYRPDQNAEFEISVIKYSPTGQQLWTRFYGQGPETYMEWPIGVAADADGNIYVAGTESRNLSGGWQNYITLKYAPDGTQLWARAYNGPQGRSDEAAAMKLDAAGNCVVTGYSYNVQTGPTQDDEMATVKYDPAGNQLWAQRRSTAQISDRPADLVIDSQNNIYVAGTATTSRTVADSQDIFVVKYAPGGTQLWSAQFNGHATTPKRDEAKSIALDGAGGVYVAGHNRAASTQFDFLLLKYNAATGALQWNRNWSGASNDYVRDLAVDGAGNAYLVGETYDAAYEAVTGHATYDAATVKFDGSGNAQWANVYRAFTGLRDRAQRVVLDASGAVYVAMFVESHIDSDTVIFKYRSDGTEAWAYSYDNPEMTYDTVHDMVADGAGDLYVTGWAHLRNSSGATSDDFVTFKLAASTASLNTPPDVELIVNGPTIVGNSGAVDAPATNGPTIVGGNLTLRAEAFDHDGQIMRVEFYANGVLLGTDTIAPYSYEWRNVAPGTYAVTATAFDDDGAVRSSRTETVTVGAGEPTPTPTPTPVPTPTPSGPVNVALAANGGLVNASSTYDSRFDAASLNNGDRRGAGWGAGGGWNDATLNAHPDWIEVSFNGAKSISTIDVFTVQDNFASPAEPTETMTFTKYGVTSLRAEYWTGGAWAIVPGTTVSSNNRVWRRLAFAPLTTTKIRVVAVNALDGYSRLVEVEAWGTTAPPPARINVALASNGATAAASSSHSSNFPAASTINGDRKGLNWGTGGGWNDATANAYPDWVEVTFSGAKTIDQIDLFTVQDAFTSPTEPTELMTFTKYGVTQFDVQAWDGGQWLNVPGASVVGNNKVWSKVTFAPVTTTKIRVLVRGALDGYSRIAEIEAWQVGG